MIKWFKIVKGIGMKKLILSIYDVIHSSTTTDLPKTAKTPVVKEKILKDEDDFINDPLFIDLMYKKIMGFDAKAYNKKVTRQFIKNHRFRFITTFGLSAIFVMLLNFMASKDFHMIFMMGLFGTIISFLLFVQDKLPKIGIVSDKDDVVSKIHFTHEDYTFLSQHYSKKTIKNLLEIMESENPFSYYSFDSIVQMQESQNGIESLMNNIDDLSPEHIKKLKRNEYAESLYLDKKD